MTIIENTLETEIETWDDPGDYPSGAGGGTLASYDYVAAINGRLVLQLDADENIDDVIEDGLDDIDLGNDIRITEWNIVETNKHTFILTVKEFEEV
jgi:hypothetical protein